MCGDRDVGERYVWLTGGIEGTSWLSLQLDFDLVCKLPQIGYGLAQIGILSMDSAGVCGGCEGDHYTELLECRFHGFSFDKMTLVTAPAGEVIIPPSFLLYSRRVMALLGRSSGLRPFYWGGSRYEHCLLAGGLLGLLLEQLQKPLSASSRQLPRGQLSLWDTGAGLDKEFRVRVLCGEPEYQDSDATRGCGL